MRKSLLNWFAMATILVGTGCSSDEVVNDYSQENAIKFGSYVGRDAQGRAAETTSDNIQDFGVFAYYTQGTSLGTPKDAPNFMNNQKVEKKTYNKDQNPLTYQTGWQYTPIKYWPNNEKDKVTFFAYSPYSKENRMESGATSLPSFKVADGTDYLWASSVEHSKQKIDENVQFDFQHVMSRVAFYVEAMVDEVNADNTDGKTDTETKTDDPIANGTEVVVTKVTLSGNLATSGSVTWKKNGDTWKSVLTPDAATNKTHTLTSGNFKTQYTSTIGNAIGQKVTDDKTLLSNENSYLMLVPQKTEVTIDVEYSVITTDGNLISGYSKVDNKNTSTFNFEFVKNCAYNFNLHIGMTSVKLSATMSNGWNTPSDIVVNVPLNSKTEQTTTEKQ